MILHRGFIVRGTVSKKRQNNSEKGSILIFSLWTLIVLSILAVGSSQRIQHKMNILRNLEERDELRGVAEAGIKRAIAELSIRRDSYSLKNLVNLTGPVRVGSGRYQLQLPASQKDRTLSALGYVIMDENRKINLNTSEPVILKQLFSTFAEVTDEKADRLAFAIVDYRDADDLQKKYLDANTETKSYELAGLSYGPKNASFEYVSELLLVKGMTREIFNAIQDHATIYGDGKVNLNTTTAEILGVLGIQPKLATKILETRRGEDGMDGTEDDYVFVEADNLIEEITLRLPELNDQERSALGDVLNRDLISVNSDHFEIVSDADLPARQKHMSIVCVYSIRDGIRYWMEI